MSETENAYTCLTEIQGCESFHLSPESSLEEIQRAYDTQIMIWHPDKNPGDAEALKQYKLIQRAYDTLKDPTRRAAHDQRLLDSLESASSEDDSKPSRVEEPPRQPRPPEDLGKIPTTATPFAFVDRDPQPGTPAYDAGLERGDAILRIGDASHLQDVQSELQAGLNRPVPVLVVDFSGRFLKKWVVPHSWDSWAPASLLGCQMSDSCPIDLWQHPVFPRPKTMDDEYEDEEEGLVRQGYRKRSLTTPRNTCCARLLLAFVSLLGLSLGGVIILYPAYSYHILDIWQLPALDCSMGAPEMGEPVLKSIMPKEPLAVPALNPLPGLSRSSDAHGAAPAIGGGAQAGGGGDHRPRRNSRHRRRSRICGGAQAGGGAQGGAGALAPPAHA